MNCQLVSLVGNGRFATDSIRWNWFLTRSLGRGRGGRGRGFGARLGIGLRNPAFPFPGLLIFEGKTINERSLDGVAGDGMVTGYGMV